MNSIRFRLDRALRFVLLTAVASSAACSGHEPTSPIVGASLSISSGGQTVLVVQQTLQLTATVRDSGGAAVTGQSVLWTSSDSTVASVSSGGVVTG